MTRFCSNCGSPLEEGYSFCENCGASADQPSDQVLQAVSQDAAGEGRPSPAPESEPVQATADNTVPEGAQCTGGAAAGAAAAGVQDYEVPSAAPIGPIFNAGVAKKASGLAIASLVLGILSIVTSGVVVGLAFGVVAIVLFAVARKKQDRSGMGIAGLVTGIVGVVLSVIAALIFACFAVGFVVAEESGPLVHDEDGIHYSIGNADVFDETTPVGLWLASDCLLTHEGADYEDGVFTLEEARETERNYYDFSLLIEEDGTFVMGYGDKTKSGTWTADSDCITLEFDDSGKTIPLFAYDDDRIVDPTSGREFDEIALLDSGLFIELER